MTYGLSTRAPVEAGPVEPANMAETKGPAVRKLARPWNRLSAASRLEVIEQALRAANDRIDAYPLAL